MKNISISTKNTYRWSSWNYITSNIL